MDDSKDKRRIDESKLNEDKERKADVEKRDTRSADTEKRDDTRPTSDDLGDGMEAGNKSQAEGVIYDV